MSVRVAHLAADVVPKQSGRHLRHVLDRDGEQWVTLGGGSLGEGWHGASSGRQLSRRLPRRAACHVESCFWDMAAHHV